MHFYSGKNRYYLNEIFSKIENKEKLYYCELIKYVMGNYIKITFDPEIIIERGFELFNSNTYIIPEKFMLSYSFPLIKNIINEILFQKGFIDMKDPRFLELPPQLLGANFDIEMTNILKNLMDEEYFFEYKEKIKIYIDDILEKKENENEQIYKKKDVIKKINENELLMRKKKECENINFKNYSCIGVFQNDFCGKAFDILFFTKEKGMKFYNMDLIQIKCSDSYKEDKKELIFQITYVKEKFSYLLNIEIGNIYLSYLSIFQKPKKFAESNKRRVFLYNIITDKFVNFENVEYKAFPILADSLVYSAEDSNCLKKIINELIDFYDRPIKLIKEEKDLSIYNTESINFIKNSLKNNEVYIYADCKGVRYYSKIDNKFFSCIKEIDNYYEGIYQNIFEAQ